VKIFERNCRTFLLIGIKLAVVACLYSCAGGPRKEARSTSLEPSNGLSDQQKLQSDATNTKGQNNPSSIEILNENHFHDTLTGLQEPIAEYKEKLDVSQSLVEGRFESDERIQPLEANGDCEYYFKSTVKSNISFPYSAENLSIAVDIKLTSSRLVGEIKIASGSGNAAFDAQVERGIRRTGELPTVCPTDIFVVVRHDQKNLLGSAPVLRETHSQKSRNVSLSATVPTEAEREAVKNSDLSPSSLVVKNDTVLDENLNSKNNENALSIRHAPPENKINDSIGKNGVKKSVEQASKDKQSTLRNLDGDWYSYKWKYGYTLKDGIGYATITNTSNYAVGQEIVRLTSVGDKTFTGESIHSDGKIYKVNVTLQSDGRLFFEDEKNVQWAMERIKIADLVQIKQKLLLNTDASPTPSASDQLHKDKKISSKFNQKQFIQLVRQAQNSYRLAMTDMQRDGVKAKRDKAICEIARNSGGLIVSNWVGKIINLSANGEGKGVLGIEIAPSVTIKTWNSSLSDVLHHTLIEPGSKLFEKSSAMKIGQIVQFSGTFHPGPDPECIYEANITLNGKVSEPEFIMTFSDIKKK
jgi:hypothetical protein